MFLVTVVSAIMFLLLVEFFRALGQEPNTGLPMTLQWDNPNPPGVVAAYNVLEQQGSNWVLLQVALTNKASLRLSAGLHKLAVTAVSTWGMESEKSSSLDIGVVLAVINLTVSQP